MEMMEEEKISMVLVRATELRSKLANCIHKTTTTTTANGGDNDDGNYNNDNTNHNEEGAVDDDEVEAETLLDICDSFDSLESQLASLQGLQQQQQYEREAAIAEIECSRKALLKKLGEYRGEHIDVVQEAEAFASMKVEQNNDLLLPPYPTRSPGSVVWNNGNLSRFSYTRKLQQNGYADDPKRSQTQTGSNRLLGGLKFLVSSTAKTMLTLVGVVSLLSLAGFETRLSRKGANLKVSNLLKLPDLKEKKLAGKCPPGKVAVMEDGEVRCIVKERVEIPFDSVAENPDVNYGCG